MNKFKIAAIFCLPLTSFPLKLFSVPFSNYFVFEHINNDTIGSRVINPIYSPDVTLIKINWKEMSSPARQQHTFPAELQNLSNQIVKIITRQTTPDQRYESRSNDSSGLLINLKRLTG